MINNWHLQQAVARVRDGEVIAYPTEAVWGLGCDPTDGDAVRQILTLKSRPQHKGLVVVAADLDQLGSWLQPLSASHQAQVEATWPGPVSWVLPCHDDVPQWVRGRHSSIAVRVTDHPLVRALCQQVGPLISTSANPAGRQPARSALAVRQYFQDNVHILPGNLGGRRQPSTIRTLDGQVLR